MKISVIVNTYNWHEALTLCLQSLLTQSDRAFEIIVADDGSRPETATLISAFAQKGCVAVRHVWHEDLGFRRSMILNKAIQAATGDYLVFVDGDCICQPDFVAQHRRLSVDGHLVTGSRVLLGRTLSTLLCAEGKWDDRRFRANIVRYRLTGQISKIMALLFRLPSHRRRNYRKFAWRRIKGCNLACWKADALMIGGFDEGFVGWGSEDIDFVFRLQRKGLVRRSGTWATEVLHIWHKPADRTAAAINKQVVLERIRAADSR